MYSNPLNELREKIIKKSTSEKVRIEG